MNDETSLKSLNSKQVSKDILFYNQPQSNFCGFFLFNKWRSTLCDEVTRSESSGPPLALASGFIYAAVAKAFVGSALLIVASAKAFVGSALLIVPSARSIVASAKSIVASAKSIPACAFLIAIAALLIVGHTMFIVGGPKFIVGKSGDDNTWSL